MRLGVLATGLLLVVLGTAVPARASAITLKTDDVGGGFFDLKISAVDFSDLIGYSFKVNFDPAVAFLDSVSEGSFLADSGSLLGTSFFSVPDVSGASVEVFNFILGMSQATGSGLLATLHFQTVGAGSPGILLDSLSFIDSNSMTIEGIDVISLDDTNPTPVPEPSTLTLLGLGLFGLRKRIRTLIPSA